MFSLRGSTVSLHITQDSEEVSDSVTDQKVTTSHGVATIKKTQSVQDYFSRKMAARTAQRNEMDEQNSSTVVEDRTVNGNRTDKIKGKRTSKKKEKV